MDVLKIFAALLLLFVATVTLHADCLCGGTVLYSQPTYYAGYARPVYYSQYSQPFYYSGPTYVNSASYYDPCGGCTDSVVATPIQQPIDTTVSTVPTADSVPTTSSIPTTGPRTVPVPASGSVPIGLPEKRSSDDVRATADVRPDTQESHVRPAATQVPVPAPLGTFQTQSRPQSPSIPQNSPNQQGQPNRQDRPNQQGQSASTPERNQPPVLEDETELEMGGGDGTGLGGDWNSLPDATGLDDPYRAWKTELPKIQREREETREREMDKGGEGTMEQRGGESSKGSQNTNVPTTSVPITQMVFSPKPTSTLPPIRWVSGQRKMESETIVRGQSSGTSEVDQKLREKPAEPTGAADMSGVPGNVLQSGSVDLAKEEPKRGEMTNPNIAAQPQHPAPGPSYSQTGVPQTGSDGYYQTPLQPVPNVAGTPPIVKDMGESPWTITALLVLAGVSTAGFLYMMFIVEDYRKRWLNSISSHNSRYLSYGDSMLDVSPPLSEGLSRYRSDLY
ncbi:MAG: hypothetical protein ACRC10_01840 [Thermoguttaceae bacterium]